MDTAAANTALHGEGLTQRHLLAPLHTASHATKKHEGMSRVNTTALSVYTCKTTFDVVVEIRMYTL